MPKEVQTYYTWGELVVKAIQFYGRPCLRKEIEKYLIQEEGKKITTTLMGTILTHEKKKKSIATLKFPGIPSFYCNPIWIGEDNKLKEGYEFNPHWKTFTTLIESNED